ncbi:MAG: AzlC family ABC transporter permease [Firmicutes bacterium]|nr:AzlC family ABC transporter permease [Bacillota bacterium]
MENKRWYRKGLKNGIPIGLGYFAVGFTLGIAAKEAGIDAVQMGLMSLLMNASAGQFAVITIVAGQAGYVTMILTQLVINIRYMLMSCALSQKISPKTPMWQRLIMANYVTDEVFGIAVAVPEQLNPFYNFGAATVASPSWALGTVLGVLVGNILPASLTSALSVALYGMFLAVVIPASKSDRVVAAVVVISMIGSAAFTFLPYFSELSSGTRIIVLTLVIAAAAAVVCPVPAEKIAGGTKEAEEETRKEAAQ